MNNPVVGEKPMKALLTGLSGIVLGVWLLDMSTTGFPAGSQFAWIARQQALYLSGLLSIAFMSLCLLLSIRPVWLETPLGGLDRIYRLHKWSGILAVSFGAAHWLVKQSGGLFKALVGSEGRPPKIRHDGLLEALRELGDDMGEPALYIALGMLAITLWRRFPYSIWRHLHRIMPVLYLMLAFHAAVLAPPAYWRQPTGAMLAIFMTIGVIASFISLTGRIGRNRQFKGTVVSIHTDNDITEIVCCLDGHWPGHRPGQFAFITFSQLEGAHPFTLASADCGDQTIRFCIKALGDFTQRIGKQIEIGQTATVEGPYGRFQLNRHSSRRRQIWIAGGIGVTPFLAWLESLQNQPADAPEADLHYCTRNRETDQFVDRLQTLSYTLPGIRLHVHSAHHGEKLTAPGLNLGDDPNGQAEIWFCGPRGLADALKKNVQESWSGNLRFHQEAFEMR